MASWLPASVSSALGLAPDEPAPPMDLGPKLAEMEAALASRPEVERLLRQGGEQGLAAAGIGAATLRRWLTAEKGDAAAAVERLSKHAQWRAEYVPDGAIAAVRGGAWGAGWAGGGRTQSGRARARTRRHKPPPPPPPPQAEVAKELAAGKAFVQGCDAAGRPVVVVRVAAHKRARGASPRIKRFICWVLDVAAASVDDAKNPDGKLVAIFDLRGISVDSLDAPALKSIFELLQAHFPERLARMTFVDAPIMFYAVWRVVSPFIDPVTRQKVAFASVAALPVDFPPSCLPDILGGGAPLICVADQAERVGLLPRGAAAAARAATPAATEQDEVAEEEDAELEAAVRRELAAAAAGDGEGGGAPGSPVGAVVA